MATYQARPAVSQPYYAAAVPTHGAPAGTFAPGTKVQVGSHRVVIEKYLSEGGFAHVYVVKLPAPQTGTAVLKRVAVPDKETLANMRNEVETMKKLKGHTYIVTYIDSHASQLKGGGYEVFLLMEYCAGGGLIDFMNTRLKNRLTEPEILDIFGDAAEGVACMHYLKPPLLHRDLKVENILISKGSDGKRMYKLCDFGSSAPPRPAATSPAEGRLIEEDVQRHTTLQYRSPEMTDVYRNRPIDEKSDLWALGVLLYKLCYYTTPFEEQGQMAILSASFKFPAYPPFSDKVKKLIATMLMEDPMHRPNIYQIVKDVSAMRGKPCPIKDIYSARTQSEARSSQQLPPREPNVKSPPMVGAKIEAPQQVQQYVPEVTPMRRGRPTAPSQQSTSARPSPSPSKKPAPDPFAALDSKNYDERAKAVDELSQKYPAVDDFSSLQSKGKFEFGGNSSKAPPKPARPSDVNQRVMNALADQAFAASAPTKPKPLVPSSSQAPPRTSSRPQPVPEPVHVQPSPSQPIEQPQPQRPGMVSTGTMTSRPSSPSKPTPPQQPKQSFEVWRVPQRSEDSSPRLSSITRFDNLTAKHPTVRDLSRSPQPEMAAASSSRPSLEGGRPVGDPASDIHRSRSTNAAPEQQHSRRGSGLFRRSSSKREAKRRSCILLDQSAPPSPTIVDDTNIASDVDYLRALEAENEANAKSGHRRSSSAIRNIKHASLPSLGGAKQKFAGRLGDTFKRFENNRNTPPQSDNTDASASTAAPLAAQAESSDDLDFMQESSVQSTSAAADERIDITEDAPPELRREMERRQLEAEERRVEEAAQAYRQRLANDQATGGGPASTSTRASAIQNRVKSLLDESGRVSPVKKTAEGYGRYTERNIKEGSSAEQALREDNTGATQLRTDIHKSHSIASSNPAHRPHPVASKPANLQKPVPPKPNVTPKPVALRTGGKPSIPTKPSLQTHHTPVNKIATPNLMDNSPDRPSQEGVDGAPSNLMDASPSDWESNFAKRYPRLSLDLVEAEIGPPEQKVTDDRRPPGGRVKDV